MSPQLKQEIEQYYVELCNRLNEHLPCKSQADKNAIGGLITEMKESKPNVPKPNVYWDRKVWIDNEFNDEKCWQLLFHSDKLTFVPSDDIEEHPGIHVVYKTTN